MKAALVIAIRIAALTAVHFVCYAANRQAVKELYQRLGRLAGATGAAVDAMPPVDDPC
jgi:hypothetical protein